MIVLPQVKGKKFRKLPQSETSSISYFSLETYLRRNVNLSQESWESTALVEMSVLAP